HSAGSCGVHRILLLRFARYACEQDRCRDARRVLARGGGAARRFHPVGSGPPQGSVHVVVVLCYGAGSGADSGDGNDSGAETIVMPYFMGTVMVCAIAALVGLAFAEWE